MTMGEPRDNALYLRAWAKDIRDRHGGKSVDADRLDTIAAEIDQLRAALRPFADLYRSRFSGATGSSQFDAWVANLARAAELVPEEPGR